MSDVLTPGTVLVHLSNPDPEAGLVEVSVEADECIRGHWLSREWLWLTADMLFSEYRMLVFKTTPENVKVRRMLTAVGATDIFIPNLYGRDRHAHLFTLTLDQFAASKFARR